MEVNGGDSQRTPNLFHSSFMLDIGPWGIQILYYHQTQIRLKLASFQKSTHHPCLSLTVSVVLTPDSDSFLLTISPHVNYIDLYSIHQATLFLVVMLSYPPSCITSSLMDKVKFYCICVCSSYFHYLLLPTRLLAQIVKFDLVHATSTFRSCRR